MKKTPRDKWFAVQEYFATLFSSSLRRRVFAGGIVVLFLLTTFLFSGKGLVRRYELLSQRSHLQQELRQAQTEQDSLRTLRDRLQNDPFMIEKVAREQYGMIRPGETVYRLAPEQEQK
ncbi:MAG TPA: septum formation initiator family protein [Candidatus Kapabacteria bacterium]|nr:septum formation initiator family protein [Candidatus Kapabacteria bacterium]